MASIVSSEITIDNIQVDDRRLVREKHTDNAGNIFNFDYMAPKDADVNALMLARIPVALSLSEDIQNPPGL